METIEKDILVDLRPRLVQADTGKRFANYLIDFIIFYVLFFTILIGAFIASSDSSEGVTIDAEKRLWIRLFAILMYAVFMGIAEGLFKGRSIGKLITGTNAVNENGTDISFSTAMARGFCRLVPFEVFSALGSPAYPWHDKWNKTYVIDVRRSGFN